VEAIVSSQILKMHLKSKTISKKLQKIPFLYDISLIIIIIQAV